MTRRTRPAAHSDAPSSADTAHAGRASDLRSAIRLFRSDAARWIVPEQISPIELLTARDVLRLTLRHPPLRAMAWFRLAAWAHQRGVRGVPSVLQRRLLRVYGLEMSPSVPTGGGLYVAHPVGCVLMAEAIGENVTVISQVTFGTRQGARWPVIGDRTFFGAGARVLGGIHVGEGGVVGANAVVLRDVPPGATVVGVPAKEVVREARS